MPPIGTAAGVFRAATAKFARRDAGKRISRRRPYDPDARIKEIDRRHDLGRGDADPFGLGFYGIDDAEFELRRRCCAPYNDGWRSSARRIPTGSRASRCSYNDGPALAVQELERAKKLGFVGVMIPTVAGEACRNIASAAWTLCGRRRSPTTLSVNIHAGTARERSKKTNLIQASGGRNPTDHR